MVKATKVSLSARVNTQPSKPRWRKRELDCGQVTLYYNKYFLLNGN